METVHTAEPPEGTGMFPELDEGRRPRERKLKELAAQVARIKHDGGRAIRRYERWQRVVDRLGEQIRPDTPTDPQLLEAYEAALHQLGIAMQELHVIETGRQSPHLPSLQPLRTRWPRRLRERQRPSESVRRPRSRGAGRPAGARRDAASSQTSSCDPGSSDGSSDGPAPSARSRPSRHRGWRPC